MKTVRAILAGLTMALWSSAAAADVVGPPATNCPGGSKGETCHGGPYCAPIVCTSDAECTSGATCQERQLCLGELSCVGGWAPTDAEPPMTPQITGECAGGAACAAGSTCTTMKVCVAPGGGGSSSSGSGDGGGCSVHAPSAQGSALAALGAIVAGAALLAGRHQRRSQRRR